MAGLLLFACTKDDDSGGKPDDVEGVDLADPAPTTTQPRATDADTVRPHLQDLVDRYDEALNAILADPSVAQDPDDDHVAGYLSLFDPGSDVGESTVGLWADDADAGKSYEAVDPELPAIDTRVDGPVVPHSDEEVAFAVCQEQQYRVLAADGSVEHEVPHAEPRGEWTAVWVDGTWRLSKVEMISNVDGCITRSEG